MKIKLGRELARVISNLIYSCDVNLAGYDFTKHLQSVPTSKEHATLGVIVWPLLLSVLPTFLCFHLHDFSLRSRIVIFLIAAFFQDNLRSTRKDTGQVESTSLCFTTGLVYLQKIIANSDITLPQSEKEACGSMFMTISILLAKTSYSISLTTETALPNTA